MEQNTVARPALFGSTDLGVEKAVSHPKITSCSFLRKIGSSSSYPEVSISVQKKDEDSKKKEETTNPNRGSAKG